MTSWVRLLHRGHPAGSGILLTTRLAVTAHHCVRDIEDPDAELSVSVNGAAAIPASVHEVAPASDLAILRLSKPTVGEQTLLPVRGSRGDRWFAPGRPGPSDPELTGTVAQGALEYECQAGGTISALQLTTSSDLSNYHGYSGGPVVREPEPAFMGVLIEQYPDRLHPERATNTLFAASVEEIIDQFEVLSSGYLFQLLLYGHADISTAPGVAALKEPHEAPSARSRRLVEEALAAEDELEPNLISTLVIRLAKGAVDVG